MTRESGVYSYKSTSGLMTVTLEISSRSSVGSTDSSHPHDKMKFLIVSFALVAVILAQQPHQQHLQQPAILKQTQDISPEGSYSFAYETENGIAAVEQGSPQPIGPKDEHVVISEGHFEYTAPDGTPIAVQYTADQNGFHPQGAHLPVAPAVPHLIARAVDYILSHPQPENQH